MGRWAQRRIAGGGISPAAALIFMTEAALSDPDVVLVTYSANVTAGDFGANDFEALPSSTLGSSITQFSPDTLEITFTNPVNADTSLTYSGGATGIQTPQTVPLL